MEVLMKKITVAVLYLTFFFMLLPLSGCFSKKLAEQLEMEDTYGVKYRAEPEPPTCGSGRQLEKVTDEICEGSGFLKDQNCPACSGQGQLSVRVWSRRYGGYVLVPKRCPECAGSGYLVHKLCNGYGWVWKCVQ